MKVINFFGAPGAGKSTASAGLFHEMKKQWIEAELVTEFAKELVWAGSQHMLTQQHYVFANQEHRLNRLVGQIDVAISDSPLLLSAYYAPSDYPESFSELVVDFFARYDNINFFVNRSHRYSLKGRIQDEAAADAIAKQLKQFLHQNKVPFYEITAADTTPKYLMHWLVKEKMLPFVNELPHPLKPPSVSWQPPLIYAP